MAIINLKPLGDRIIVEPLEQEEVTASGIVLPEMAKEKPQRGTVLAVGPGKKDDNGNVIPMSVVVGDIVLYAKYGGADVRIGSDQEVLIIHEGDLLAIVVSGGE